MSRGNTFFPPVAGIFSTTSVADFIPIQPMDLPRGLVFYLDYKYGEQIYIQLTDGGVVVIFEEWEIEQLEMLRAGIPEKISTEDAFDIACDLWKKSNDKTMDYADDLKQMVYTMLAIPAELLKKDLK